MPTLPDTTLLAANVIWLTLIQYNVHNIRHGVVVTGHAYTLPRHTGLRDVCQEMLPQRHY